MARAMKDSGIPWIREIPANWTISRIKNEFLNLDHLREPISAEKRDNKLGLYDYFGASGVIDKIDQYNVDDTVLLIGEDGANLRMRNLPLVYRASGKFWVNNHAHVLKVKPNNNYSYMAYLLEAGDYSVYITGSAQPKLSQFNLMNFQITVPPASEQIMIAEYLDAQCAEINAVLDKTRTSIEEYKKLKQAIITQAVTKGIWDDCDNWKRIKIKWLLIERKERSTDGTEEPLSMSQKYGILPTKEMDIVPNMASSFVGAKLVQCGDLVFNKLKAHLGVFSVSSYDGLVSPDYAVYYTTELANAKYLEYLFKTPQYISEFKKRATGIAVGLTRLYTGDLYSITCVLPSIEEQQEIVKFLCSRVDKMDTLIQKKEQFLSELETYKKSLIYEYVTGKKEVP